MFTERTDEPKTPKKEGEKIVHGTKLMRTTCPQHVSIINCYNI
jgi:hypothetical protein